MIWHYTDNYINFNKTITKIFLTIIKNQIIRMLTK